MAIGEGGGELVKQLLENTYDVAYPGVVAVYLTGKPRPAWARRTSRLPSSARCLKTAT